MSDILAKGNLIRQIRNGQNLDAISAYVRERLFQNGPTEILTLEIISYLKLFQPEYFKQIEMEILELMGLFFKNPIPESMQGLVFDIYHQHIKELYGENYTPVQANIIKQLQENQYFSFSAPTSTGKSFVFRNLILSSKHDVAVIVPSRALINEYFDRIGEIVSQREINVLTFVDHINTKHAHRNIFILTPERARELFKNKSWLNIDLLLFDEAQLSDEKSVRGLYFDSIVRRAIKAFSTAKFVFAHPFISNPQAQLQKNNIVDTASCSHNYLQKNVGQIFYVHNPTTGKFYHLGTDKQVLGKQKLETNFDPIESIIKNGGSVLIYVPKTHIYSKKIYTQFAKYIQLCLPIQEPEAKKMIDSLRTYIGASIQDKHFYNSEMLEKLSYGIVTHHGSMPLAARLILEHFTQKGYCRICFATSTLEQGINMPFDLVYLNRFEGSKSLSVKNLIGRAGRSTIAPKFDFGSVVIRQNAIDKFRKVVNKQEPLSEVSRLDAEDDSLDEKYNEFKDAIKNDTFSDEYNLTNADLEKLRTEDVTTIIPTLLDMMFSNGILVEPSADMKDIYDDFDRLYSLYLGRELVAAESAVLNNAIKIMIWKVYGRTFCQICQYRYAYASHVQERRTLIKENKLQEAEHLPSHYICGYHDIPNKNLVNYPLYPTEIKAQDVDYDLIVYDTYDYLDKLIGFKLSDIFYAIFDQYYITNNDERARKLALYFKYGTDKDNEIWMLRYGLTFEDIEWLAPCIEKIDEMEIVFNNNVQELTDEQKKVIEPYFYE